jgi:basic membrane protein A
VHDRILTSAVKQLGASTFDLLRLAKDGKLLSGNYYGKVGFAPFHELEDQIPPDVKNRLERIAAQLNEGELKTGVPEAKP